MTTRDALTKSLERLYAEQRAGHSLMTSVQREAFRYLEDTYHLIGRSPLFVDRWAELLEEELTGRRYQQEASGSWSVYQGQGFRRGNFPTREQAKEWGDTFLEDDSP